MKKAICLFVVAVLLLPIGGYAEEMADLQMEIDRCNYKAWSEGNFACVKIPEGEYTVGIDLPAGQYYVRSASETIYCHVIAAPYDIDTYELSMQLYHPRNWTGFYGSDQKAITLENGDEFCIQQVALMLVSTEYVADFTGSAKEKNNAVLAKYTRTHQDLREKIKSFDAWQEGSLPEGIWEIGKSLPAQRWTLSSQGDKTVTVFLGDVRSSETQVFPERVYELNGAVAIPLDLSAWKLIQIVGGAVKLQTYAGHDLFEFE